MYKEVSVKEAFDAYAAAKDVRVILSHCPGVSGTGEMIFSLKDILSGRYLVDEPWNNELSREDVGDLLLSGSKEDLVITEEPKKKRGRKKGDKGKKAGKKTEKTVMENDTSEGKEEKDDPSAEIRPMDDENEDIVPAGVGDAAGSGPAEDLPSKDLPASAEAEEASLKAEAPAAEAEAVTAESVPAAASVSTETEPEAVRDQKPETVTDQAATPVEGKRRRGRPAGSRNKAGRKAAAKAPNEGTNTGSVVSDAATEPTVKEEASEKAEADTAVIQEAGPAAEAVVEATEAAAEPGEGLEIDEIEAADEEPTPEEPKKKTNRGGFRGKGPRKSRFDVGKVIALWKAGWEVSQIAEEFFCDEEKVAKVLQDRGLISTITRKHR